MTAQVMLWFKDCKDQGLFTVLGKSGKDFGPVWDAVLTRCQRAWPQFPWTKTTISVKFATEKRRFKAFKMLLRYPGVSFNRDTGLPEAPETTWEAFLLKNNTPNRHLRWLRRISLGNPDIYEAVFRRERPAGTEILEPSGSQAVTNDDDADLTSSTTATVTRPSPARRHRLQSDADQTPLRDHDPPGTMRKKGRDADDEVRLLSQSLREAATVLASPRLPGAADLELALEDLQRLFAGKISDEEMFNCCEYFLSNPVRAAGWKKLGLNQKKLFVERWKTGRQ